VKIFGGDEDMIYFPAVGARVTEASAVLIFPKTLSRAKVIESGARRLKMKQDYKAVEETEA